MRKKYAEGSGSRQRTGDASQWERGEGASQHAPQTSPSNHPHQVISSPKNRLR